MGRMGVYPEGGQNHVWILTLSYLGLTCWAEGSGSSRSMVPATCSTLPTLHPSPSIPPVREPTTTGNTNSNNTTTHQNTTTQHRQQ